MVVTVRGDVDVDLDLGEGKGGEEEEPITSKVFRKGLESCLIADSMSGAGAEDEDV